MLIALVYNSLGECVRACLSHPRSHSVSMLGALFSAINPSFCWASLTSSSKVLLKNYANCFSWSQHNAHTHRYVYILCICIIYLIVLFFVRFNQLKIGIEHDRTKTIYLLSNPIFKMIHSKLLELLLFTTLIKPF